MTVLQRMNHYEYDAPNMALLITDLCAIPVPLPHSARSLERTYYPTQFWRLLHSFAIRHVCNFLLTLTPFTLWVQLFLLPLCGACVSLFSLVLFLGPVQAASID